MARRKPKKYNGMFACFCVIADRCYNKTTYGLGWFYNICYQKEKKEKINSKNSKHKADLISVFFCKIGLDFLVINK